MEGVQGRGSDSSIVATAYIMPDSRTGGNRDTPLVAELVRVPTTDESSSEYRKSHDFRYLMIPVFVSTSQMPRNAATATQLNPKTLESAPFAYAFITDLRFTANRR